jgi:ribosomal protein S18 acetylase RimI-like enzyme
MLNHAIVRRLEVTNVQDYRTIRLSALKTAPDAFGADHDVEAGRPIAQHAARLTTSLVFGAYVDGRIVGMAGLRPGDGPKEAHKGLLWGFYVEPASRKDGVGAALMQTLLQAARGVIEQVTLTVVADNAAAIALYEKFGFKHYGLEPRALKSAAGYVDEALMVLFLDAQPR